MKRAFFLRRQSSSSHVVPSERPKPTPCPPTLELPMHVSFELVRGGAYAEAAAESILTLLLTLVELDAEPPSPPDAELDELLEEPLVALPPVAVAVFVFELVFELVLVFEIFPLFVIELEEPPLQL